MAETAAQLRRWTTEQKHIVDSLTLDAQRTLEGDKENLASKKEELSAALAAGDALRQSSEEERSRAEQLRQELEVLSSQEALLPAEHAKLSKSLEGQRRARDPPRAGKESKLAELQKGCAMYKQLLALDFERVGGETQQRGGREAAERRQRGGREAALVESLNQTNDFSVFVRTLRAEFKRLCA
ncbi:hypothetical protein EMIHUDRAFT_210753 [Emiliania huxleyi CCMP1516]|uniref:Kinetochore protein SPC25 n=2 Tax=Emiliania huxleyi TaxID=2903 RepID=A0A0D3IYN6_EMIH1|nr:hypothetical protein EMIHUDRAFT_210753 [Emiliania huxleyi CCMP1516]EOD16371.1 hypothetical protein EMIHUDRAFT_210753 [Emiliania huxleyi CCMP1516]|eukprot:XP_005768800.1 hypothetical protein EMIHUDRAFT_210753 [Emiliania huxleyi CCMP1516]